MNDKDNYIFLELDNCDSVNNLIFVEEKYKYIIKGQSYCKVFDKIKGVCLFLDNNRLFLKFTIEDAKNMSGYGKFTNMIKVAKDNLLKKYDELFWNKIKQNAVLYNEHTKLDTFITQIKYKTHVLNLLNTLNFDRDNLCVFDVKNNNVHIEKKTKNNILSEKCNGGIIIDKDNNWISLFEKTFESSKFTSKYVILSNVVFPKLSKKSIDTVRKLDENLKNKILIIYHPNENLLDNVVNYINVTTQKPKLTWLILEDIKYDSKIILKILFWNKNKIYCDDINLLSFKCESFTHDRPITITKINYKLNNLENKMFKICHNMLLIEKIFLLNVNTKVPLNIFNTDNCIICHNIFDKLSSDEINCSKSYLSCGHIFCSSCVIEVLNINKLCPICRSDIKLDKLSISNLIPNKFKHLVKLLKKINNGENDKKTIIYVDNQTYAKSLKFYLKDHIESTIIRNNENIKCNIIICPKNKSILCKNIKNILNIIVMANDQVLTSESLGYDHNISNNKIKIWLFELVPTIY